VFGIDEKEVDDLAAHLKLASHLPGDDAANAGAQQEVRPLPLLFEYGGV